MKIAGIRIVGIRCFDDTDTFNFGRKFNLIVGQNNSGKSTILRSILNFQGIFLDYEDVRPECEQSGVEIQLCDVKDTDQFSIGRQRIAKFPLILNLLGDPFNVGAIIGPVVVGLGQHAIPSSRPNHKLVPFLAKRKASGFSEVINANALTPITGTLQNLYSNVDLLATAGHPRHQAYLEATRQILGLTITTKPSNGGKVAGFYFNDDKFITLDRMGDGVTEIIALITELCLSQDKIFILEEPETNLHPKGLKALLGLVRKASEHNQFIIATHSNVVVRELGGEEESKVFGVYREGDGPNSPSRVEEVERSPAGHMQLLRELGYEFTDFSLFEGWLFLEESSAEKVVRDILVPFFVPKLKGRLRTFSAAGVDNLEPTVAEFRRLMTFIHLEPAYEGRLWVRADGDDAGQNVCVKMRATFPNLDEQALSTFVQPQFEYYYPAKFAEAIEQTLAIEGKKARRTAKATLLNQVLDWTKENPEEAKVAWAESAAEVVELLTGIATKIG